MTVNDENSVYIGGLSYEAAEDTLRKAFDFYGRVVAVKIVNDRVAGGKCYGFVTFTNPRSAVNAISDMDGKRIDGRVIKVSEVKTRIGRSNFGHDSNFRRNFERGMDWERGRDREKDYDRDRFRNRLRERSVYRDQDRERKNDRTRDQERERLNDNSREHNRSSDHFVDRDRGRDQDRDMKDIEPERDKNHDLDRGRDCNSDRDQEREFEETKSHHRGVKKDTDQLSKSVNGSEGNDHHSREPLSEPSDGDKNQGYAQLDISTHKLGELQKEILEMEELLEEKREVVSKLQEKSQDLEDALSMAKRLTSHHQLQLTKLHKCYLHMKDYGERLKTSEQELQSLVDSTMVEIEYDDNVGARNGVLENGNAQHFQLV